MFFQKLYARIWLAVVLAVAVLTFLVGAAWRLAAEPPLREVVVRNAAGEVIGSGSARAMRPGLFHHHDARHERDDHGPESPLPPGSTAPDTHDEGDEPVGHYGRGPEFFVQLQDGQTMHLHLPRPPRGPWNAPFGFFWTLGLVALAVALATYPIVRRLTRRLEGLQAGVERWGDGDLSVRVPAGGADEVGFLANRFNHAAQQIENLVKARDALLASQKSLLANASHELRSPLTVVAGYLDNLAEDSGLESGWQGPVEEMRRQTFRMREIVEALLELSRLEAAGGEAPLERVDVGGLVALLRRDIMASPTPPAAFEVEMQPPALLLGAPGEVQSILTNLVTNAVKYTPPEGRVSLRWWVDAAGAHLAVTDTGIGIPAEHLPRLTERFYRVDPGRSRKQGGTGLGLAIVKHAVQRHGGSLQIESVDGRGSTFTCHFPLRRVPPAD